MKTKIKGQNFQVALSPEEKGIKLPWGTISHGERGRRELSYPKEKGTKLP